MWGKIPSLAPSRGFARPCSISRRMHETQCSATAFGGRPRTRVEHVGLCARRKPESFRRGRGRRGWRDSRRVGRGLENATGEKFDLTSNEAGAFAVPGIAVGTYTVTVTLRDSRRPSSAMSASSPARREIKAVLEIGASARRSVQLARGTGAEPVSARVLDARRRAAPKCRWRRATRLCREDAARRAVRIGAGPRAAGINGLPNNTVNITIDGVRTGNMLQSTDGFFSMVTPRLDAVEEITITGAVPGSGSGPGSVQMQFATRSGIQPVGRQCLSLLAAAGVQFQLLFNKINNLKKNEVVAHQYRLPTGRTDRHPWSVRRPQKRSSSSTSNTSTSRRGDAHPPDPAAGSAGRHLRLQRHRRRRAAPPLRGPRHVVAEQRPDHHDRSD